VILSMETNPILITGIVKDVATTLMSDIERLSMAFSRFSEISWFLVESNSTDKSLEILSKLSLEMSNFHYVSIEPRKDPKKSRTEDLAEARNRYVEEVKQNPQFSSLEYVVISDFNNLNRSLSKPAVDSCFEAEVDWDVCCANQSGKYYDIWALRHPLWSPNDCWDSHAFFRKHTFVPETSLRIAVNSRMLRIKKSSDWIEVDSAFGGLAIYKKSVILNAFYQGLTANQKPICEHVPFNLQIRQQGGRIFINPKFINFRSTDHSKRSGYRQKLLRILAYPLKLAR
jgi:hypothetical protein